MKEIPIEGEIPLGGVPSIGSDPEHGTIVLKPDGKWKYVPDYSFTGKDKFTIIITDEDGNSEEVEIEILVDEVPTGTVQKPGNQEGPNRLPQTGEESPLSFYLTGVVLVILGAGLSRRYKTRNK